MESTSYRSILYSKYHSTQIVRHFHDQVAADRVYKAEFLPHLPSNKSASILEIGCGHGPFLQFLKSKGYSSASGCDLSPEQVEIAKTNGLTVELADARDFLSGKSADVIVAIDLLEHCTKNEAVELLQLVKSVLKPGGFALFRVPNAGADFAGQYIYGDFTHELFLTDNSAIQLFQAVGFGKVDVLPSDVSVKGMLKSILASVARVCFSLNYKISMLATGRSSKGVVTPNLIIVARA